MIVSLYIERDKTLIYTIYQSGKFVLQVALDGLCCTLQKKISLLDSTVIFMKLLLKLLL